MRKLSLTVGHGAGHYARLAALAATVAVVAPQGVSAQVMDPLRGYNLNGDSVGPQQREAREPRAARQRDVQAEPQQQAERQRPAMASPGRMRRVAEGQGLRLTTMPHRRGRAFFAMAENDAGHRIQLMFNPYSGIIVGVRDLGGPAQAPTAVAKAPEPAPTTTATAKPAAPVASAAMPAPNDAELAAAKEAADKAVAAEADARHTAETASAEARRANAKLAEAQAASRRALEAKAQEARREEQIAAEQRRQEARAADAKRRALASAEAKLAQAKAVQARAAAEAAKAEAEAVTARAALQPPAEMSKAGEKPAEMAPLTKAPAEAATMSEPPAKIDSAKAQTDKVGADKAATDTSDVAKADSSKTRCCQGRLGEDRSACRGGCRGQSGGRRDFLGRQERREIRQAGRAGCRCARPAARRCLRAGEGRRGRHRADRFDQGGRTRALRRADARRHSSPRDPLTVGSSILELRTSRRQRPVLALVLLAAAAATIGGVATAQEPQHSAELDAAIIRAAKRHGVPEHLVRRIVMRESRYNPRARNHSFWGLMQISYPTARSMGFKGTPEQLLNPVTNLAYAVPYLANAFVAAGRREDAAVRLYASGYYASAKNRGVLGLLRTADSAPMNGVPDEPISGPAAVASADTGGWSLFGSSAPAPAPSRRPGRSQRRSSSPMPPRPTAPARRRHRPRSRRSPVRRPDMPPRAPPRWPTRTVTTVSPWSKAAAGRWHRPSAGSTTAAPP